MLKDRVGDLVVRVCDTCGTEKVHHINGDKEDYRISNLYLCENMRHHRKVHHQLEKISMEMVKIGIIEFDHEKGEYCFSRLMKEFISEKLGELLETPTRNGKDNQQPSSAEELAEKVQRLFRKEVHPKQDGSA